MCKIDYGGGGGGNNALKIDYVICERPLNKYLFATRCIPLVHAKRARRPAAAAIKMQKGLHLHVTACVKYLYHVAIPTDVSLLSLGIRGEAAR